jgi:DNA-directed RNA polymerase subunit L
MGGVLQSTVDNADKLGILSAGYHKPHPLENQISMNVKVNPSSRIRKRSWWKCVSYVPNALKVTGRILQSICQVIR